MSRPLRIEYPGACYHVSARGNGGQAIFTCAEDAARFLDLLGREIAQQNWRCHGWCLMESGYQLLIETPEGNLGRGMGRFAMAYSQWFGRGRGRPGHLFASRYKAILFEKQSWLLPLARHVVLEPVRAGFVKRPEQWHWSSHRAILHGSGPDWFSATDLLSGLGTAPAEQRSAWADYVSAGVEASSPWDSLRGGQYLGGPAFLRDIAARLEGRSLDQVSRNVAVPDRPTPDEIIKAVAAASGIASEKVLDRKASREAWRVAVYLLRRAANQPIRQTAMLAGVSQGRISQIQREIENAGGIARCVRWAAPLEPLLRRR